MSTKPPIAARIPSASWKNFFIRPRAPPEPRRVRASAGSGARPRGRRGRTRPVAVHDHQQHAATGGGGLVGASIGHADTRSRLAAAELGQTRPIEDTAAATDQQRKPSIPAADPRPHSSPAHRHVPSRREPSDRVRRTAARASRQQEVVAGRRRPGDPHPSATAAYVRVTAMPSGEGSAGSGGASSTQQAFGQNFARQRRNARLLRDQSPIPGRVSHTSMKVGPHEE